MKIAVLAHLAELAVPAAEPRRLIDVWGKLAVALERAKPELPIVPEGDIEGIGIGCRHGEQMERASRGELPNRSARLAGSEILVRYSREPQIAVRSQHDLAG